MQIVSKRTTLTFAVAMLLAGAVSGAPPLPDTADRVQSLPQMPDLSFGLYSGMLPITGTQKQLHYVAAFS